MEESINRFPYRPLAQLSRSQIRLLRLLPGRFEDDIFCELFHADLDEQPEYTALSYAWGGPKNTKPIRLAYRNLNRSPFQKLATRLKRGGDYHGNKRHFCEFQVTTNLESALRHLRVQDQFTTLWIDAIGINQTDVAERGIVANSPSTPIQSAQLNDLWSL